MARLPVRPKHVPTTRERREALASNPWRRRHARLSAILAYLAAAALPVVLWHDVIAGTAAEFRFDVKYLLSEWLAWGLIAAGLAFYVPVALSAGVHPDSRWYPRSRNAYAGWGITLYLLGLALATQVSQLYALHAG